MRWGHQSMGPRQQMMMLMKKNATKTLSMQLAANIFAIVCISSDDSVRVCTWACPIFACVSYLLTGRISALFSGHRWRTFVCLCSAHSWRTRVCVYLAHSWRDCVHVGQYLRRALRIRHIHDCPRIVGACPFSIGIAHSWRRCSSEGSKWYFPGIAGA